MTNSMGTVINGELKTITPNHDTVLINGIEIDKEISGLISFLWSNKIQTMRSCQDANGYIYISFLNLKDALKSGLSLFNSFMVKVVTNDHNVIKVNFLLQSIFFDISPRFHYHMPIL